MDFSNPLAVWGIPGFFIFVLGAVVVYLYKDNKNLNAARLDDLKEYERKLGALFEEYQNQQNLWFEKIQLARESKK